MTQPLSNNAYVFSEHINVQYISDLYSGDYQMIAETFADVAAEYPSLLDNIAAAAASQDLASLRKAVHKLKPLLGFTGLTDFQTQCVEFEQAYDNGATHDSILPLFSILNRNLVLAKTIIAEENERLSLFNS